MTLKNTPIAGTVDTTPTSFDDFLGVLANLKLTPSRLTVDLTARTVTNKEGAVELTEQEFGLLTCLASHPDEALSRVTILNQVWAGSVGTQSRTLDAHIVRLRKKLAEPGLISTVRGVGYRLNSSPHVHVVASRATALVA